MGNTKLTAARPDALDVALSDEIRAALQDEAKYLSDNIGDEIGHVDWAVRRGEIASESLKAQIPRIQLASKMWECVEAGRLAPFVSAFYLDEMVRLVEDALEGERRELATDRDNLQELIINGPDPRETDSREDLIAGYHGQIERTKARIRGQEAFLALAVAERERAARATADEEGADR